MQARVLTATFFHVGKRRRVGEVVEISDRAGRAAAKNGLVEILPEEAAGTPPGGATTARAAIPLDPPSKGDLETAAPEAGRDAGSPKNRKKGK